MSRITTVKDKIPKKASWPGFLASGKDSRTKVVLARKLEKQGLGSTPDYILKSLLVLVIFDLILKARKLTNRTFSVANLQ